VLSPAVFPPHAANSEPTRARARSVGWIGDAIGGAEYKARASWRAPGTGKIRAGDCAMSFHARRRCRDVGTRCIDAEPVASSVTRNARGSASPPTAEAASET
jgi:hypothetical protein